MKFFYVIYIADDNLRTLIDGMRLFADMNQKYSAHITVRGPYESKDDYTPPSFYGWEREIADTHILVSGIDTFFNIKQSTIFFKCESEELRGIWWKKHFAHYSPHITIYDRNDKEYANEILCELEKHQFNFSFKVAALEKLISDSKRYPKTQTRLFGQLINTINYELLSGILGFQVDKFFIETANKRTRLDCINRLATTLSSIRCNDDIIIRDSCSPSK
ncbi:MAG: hypothetical protein IAE95_00930 [Chitinophagaceae bacterium]|nr:hypothetical protein [Chitinophagaceae bacterium]